MILNNYFEEGGAKAELVLPSRKKERSYFVDLWGCQVGQPGPSSSSGNFKQEPDAESGAVRGAPQVLRHARGELEVDKSDDLTALMMEEDGFL